MIPRFFRDEASAKCIAFSGCFQIGKTRGDSACTSATLMAWCASATTALRQATPRIWNSSLHSSSAWSFAQTQTKVTQLPTWTTRCNCSPPSSPKSMGSAAPKPDQGWKRYEGTYRSKDYRTWVVTILDGQLSLIAPDVPNPATARTVLGATNDPTAFMMRVGPGYAPGPDGEKLTFDISADGAVAGFHTENWRFSRVSGLEAQ